MIDRAIMLAYVLSAALLIPALTQLLARYRVADGRRDVRLMHIGWGLILELTALYRGTSLYIADVTGARPTDDLPIRAILGALFLCAALYSFGVFCRRSDL